MKQIYLTLSLLILIGFSSFSQTQTTLTEDANGVINTNHVVAQTSSGTMFFVGHELGTGYSSPSAIFRAWTDNPNGYLNYFYEGITNGSTTYNVRADGQGYFAGYLGIGTTTPKANLHVIGTAVLGGGNLDPAGNLGNVSYLSNTGQMLIGWNRTAGSGETDFIANPGAGGTGGFAFYNHDNNNNNETQLMWILGTGNVLIGKSTQVNSAYKLDVAGNVRANQIVVNTNGADFVFASSYRLHSLSSLKKYIDQNHHLPEIPSATQMQADGLNVGDNQVKLLQKVEELTLYLIEQNHVNAQLQDKLKLQQAQIEELNKKLNTVLTKVNQN